MRKPRVIIIDGEVFILRMLKKFLSKRNYEVLCFDDPEVFLTYERHSGSCKNEDPCADIFIADIKMPRMTGIELLNHQSQRGCPIANRNKAVIATSMDSAPRKSLETLGCSFIQKPFQLPELSHWLKKSVNSV
jgi:CheY-like chemotaxis protein